MLVLIKRILNPYAKSIATNPWNWEICPDLSTMCKQCWKRNLCMIYLTEWALHWWIWGEADRKPDLFCYIAKSSKNLLMDAFEGTGSLGFPLARGWGFLMWHRSIIRVDVKIMLFLAIKNAILELCLSLSEAGGGGFLDT